VRFATIEYAPTGRFRHNEGMEIKIEYRRFPKCRKTLRFTRAGGTAGSIIFVSTASMAARKP
jgi:hypothetical protein